MVEPAERRPYLKQDELPRVSVDAALRVPQALADHYAKKPTAPFDVAEAMEMSPNGGAFRDLCGAAVGYGLTTGGPNAGEIGLTDLGRRAVSPLKEGDDATAKAEAVLKPSIQGDFLRRYDGSPMPAEKIALNVLESMGVPPESTERAHDIIVENAKSVGFLRELKGKTYVRLTVSAPAVKEAAEDTGDMTVEVEEGTFEESESSVDDYSSAPLGLRNRRVFISHGKNKRIVEQLKELLTFGDFEPIVSVEKESVSKPVSAKVFDDMRSCGAGIIHVSAEERLLDQQGKERLVLNENVLIEIGAAMALYADRFILLVEEGTTLPSNLQGLYEVRYLGDELGYEATMKVLKALNEFKATQNP